MNSGNDERPGSEPTFADIMNGFSFDAGRGSRKRRWGWRRSEEPAFPASGPSGSYPVPGITSVPPPPTPTTPIPVQVIDHEVGTEASAVRPYTWTRGRTKSGMELAIETLVSTSQRGREQISLLQMEHRAIAEMCEQARSVAEVAALMSLPLGVARVLLGDMAGLGVVTVHQTASSAGNAPDLALMERVLSGLRRL